MGLVVAALVGLQGCSARETVVVYSPHGPDMLGDYEALFEAEYPEIDFQWLDMGANDVYSRLQAERAQPAADIWWGAPSTLFMQAVQDELLAAYEPTWSEAVDPAYHDAAHLWYATYVSPLAILYNDREYSADEMPQTWDDLLKPEWAGRIAIRRPLESGTMRTFLCAMIARQPSVDEGIAWLQRLHENTAVYPESPALLFDHIKKNPDRITVWLLPDAILQRDRNGFPFGYVVPPDTPVLTDCIAMVQNAPHPDNARLLYEYLTTPEALVHQAEAYAKLPAREGIPSGDLPAEISELSVAPMAIDWDAFAAQESEWLGRWETEVFEAASP